MWHRETTIENPKNINMFIATGIVNRETWVIISRALELQGPEDYYGTPAWPGKRFVVYDEVNDPSGKGTQAALALLGWSRSYLFCSRNWDPD